MKTITYTPIGKECLLRDAEGAAEIRHEIRFDPPIEGYLILDGQSHRLCDGRAIVESDALRRGRHVPELLTEKGRTLCAPLIVADGEISPAPLTDKEAYALILRLCRAEESIRRMEAALADLQTAIGEPCIRL